MTSRGSARPRWSRLATRLDTSDVDGPRLSTCGGAVDHLQRLGEKRSRKQAECFCKGTSPSPHHLRSGLLGCGTQAHVLSAAHRKGICGAKAPGPRSELLLARTASCGNLNHLSRVWPAMKCNKPLSLKALRAPAHRHHRSITSLCHGSLGCLLNRCT